jgi:hypothetical protein
LHDSVCDNDVVEEQTSNNSVGDVCEIMEQDGSVKKLPSILEHTKSHYGGNESINCNGTGALGQLQRWAMIDQSIAMGQRQWDNRSNCNGTGALGQLQ